jgi:hypothetical protein
MPAGDVYRAVIAGNIWGQYMCNVLHFRAATNEDSALDLATKVASWRESQLNQFQMTEWTNQQVDVYPVIPYGVQPATKLPTQMTGLRSGLGAPPQCAIVVSIKSNSTSRRQNGRFYIPAIPAGYAQQGKLNGEAQGLAVAFGTDFLTRWGEVTPTSGYQCGVWSRLTAGDPPNFAPAAFTPINRVVVRQVIYTQRRRTIGVGV